MEQLISSAGPAIAFIGFLQTMQALPERHLSERGHTAAFAQADVSDPSAIDRLVDFDADAFWRSGWAVK
jgi:hypothetical protein